MILNKISYSNFEVQFDDLDAGGVLYHANYLAYCDRARNDVLNKLGVTFFSLKDMDIALAVVSCSLNYNKPIKNENITVSTEIKDYSKTSLKVIHKFFKGNKENSVQTEPLFECETILVAANYSTQKACKLPQQVIEALGLDL